MNGITKKLGMATLAVCSLVLTGCPSNPAPPKEERGAMASEVNATVQKMEAKDPSLRDLLNRSYAYVIFPEVGKGALVVGGSHGRGEVYKGNQFVGYADIKSVSVGLQAGGETFSELLVFSAEKPFNHFAEGKLSFAADAEAALLKAGAAAKTQFQNGVAVFVEPTGGAMAGLSLAGQQFTYRPGSRDMSENRDMDKNPTTRP